MVECAIHSSFPHILQGNSDIDIEAEIKKAEEKLAAVTLNADKLKTLQAKPEYEKTPQAVREGNAEKVNTFLLVYRNLKC